MSRRLLLTGLLILTGAVPGHAEPEEMSQEERAKLATQARKLNAEMDVLVGEGKLLEAARRCQQALAMYKTLYPSDKFPAGHADLATSLNNMGFLLEALGRLEAALEHHQQALIMLKKLYPPDKFPAGHPDLATSLNNMGFLLQALGRLEAALDHHQQALTMRKKLYPPDKFPAGHPDLATSLNNMGSLLQALGRLEAALEHHQQALTMRKKLYPPDKFPAGHPELARSLSNMGTLLGRLGRLEAALEHHQQDLAMCKKLYPPDKFPAGHADLARSLNNMGALLQALGRLEAALEHTQQALAMKKKLYPPDKFPAGHAELARSLNNMGALLQALGRLEAALEHHQQALAMSKKLYPPDRFPAGHADLARSLSNVGAILLASQQFELAADKLSEALVMERHITDNLAIAVSGAEALALARSSHSSLNLYLSASLHLPDAAPTTYQRVWIERSALSRICAQRHQAALAAAADNPDITSQFGQLRQVRAELARLLLEPLPAARAAVQERDRRVNQLTDKKQQLERDLVRLLPELDRQRQLDDLDPETLRKALPAHAAFVDLRRYTRVTFDPEKPGREGTTWTPHYLAFVVCPDQPVQRVELEDATAIEEALADWRHLIQQRKDDDSPAPARKLRRLFWDRIAEALPKETRTVFLAPDAALTWLPFPALPGSKPGTILLEDYTLALVPHGPFLLEQLRHQRNFGQGQGVPLVLGDVRYSEAPTPLSDAVAARGPIREGAALSWSDLPGSARELRLLRKLTGDNTVVLDGRDAGVPRLLRELPKARLAHLATHGFFNNKEFKREQQHAKQQATDLLRSTVIESERLGFRISAGASNPLAYTGLVLAGANQPDKAGPYAGILPGEAILDVDLRNLELAVLSACQTSLGAVADGECVHNLQQAFHIAGCPNVIASLWSVPDDSTAALMGLFYRELLDGGKTPLEALRSAQLYLYRHPGEIKNLAERGPPLLAKGAKLPEPDPQPDPKPTDRKRAAVKDWAAFVLSGAGR
jgi:CHAT domain-containing protein